MFVTVFQYTAVEQRQLAESVNDAEITPIFWTHMHSFSATTLLGEQHSFLSEAANRIYGEVYSSLEHIFNAFHIHCNSYHCL